MFSSTYSLIYLTPTYLYVGIQIQTYGFCKYINIVIGQYRIWEKGGLIFNPFMLRGAIKECGLNAILILLKMGVYSQNILERVKSYGRG